MIDEGTREFHGGSGGGIGGGLTSRIHLFSERIGVWPVGVRVDYYLVAVAILNEDVIFADLWRTVKQIGAGERVVVETVLEVETGVRYEHSNEATATYGALASAGNLLKIRGKIETALAEKVSNESYTGSKRAIRINTDYKLADAPKNPKKPYVVSRHIQCAPVHREVKAVVSRVCMSCGRTNSFSVIIYQPTDKVSTRQVDYFSDGSKSALITGCERF